MEDEPKSIADEIDDDEDISDWVTRSRLAAEEEKKKAKKRLETIDEQDENLEYTATDLTGLKVAHDFESFQEGETVILTLKDQSVLDEDEGIQLENIGFSEVDRKNHAIKESKSKYDLYGDKQQILPQYDESTEEKGFTLSQNGAKERMLSSIKSKLAAANAPISLNTQTNFATDYMETEVKPPSFRKKKKRSEKSKNGKSSNRKNKNQEDSLFSLEDILGDGDAGNTIKKEKKTNKTERRTNKKRRLLETDDLINQVRKRAKTKEEDDDKDSIEFTPITEFARGLAAQQRSEPEVKNSVIKEEEEEEEEEEELLEKDYEEMVAFVEEKTQGRNFLKSIKKKTVDENGNEITSTPIKEEEDENKPRVNSREPIISNSTAAALNYLQQKGETENATQMISGRVNDEVLDMSDVEAYIEKLKENDPEHRKFNVKLEYLDEYGRQMTPKEAWRRLSHKFHGKTPGKNKTQKRLAKVKQDLKKKRKG